MTLWGTGGGRWTVRAERWTVRAGSGSGPPAKGMTATLRWTTKGPLTSDDPPWSTIHTTYCYH